jgi:hypothetical protein
MNSCKSLIHIDNKNRLEIVCYFSEKEVYLIVKENHNTGGKYDADYNHTIIFQSKIGR